MSSSHQFNQFNQFNQFESAKPRILVVEDHIIEQTIINLLAQKYGYEAHIVSTSEEAMSALSRDEHYSLILMDWRLPGTDGLTATRQIRELEERRGYHTPVIALTARAMDGDKGKCLQAGMDDYMSKPFTAEQFKDMLNRWIPKPGKKH